MRTASPELAEQRRAQILRAAGTCFVEKGFHQSSVAEIARTAEISMGLLYRYFPNKEAIVHAFAEQDRMMLSQALTELAQCQNLRVGVELFIEQVFTAMYSSADLRIASEVLAECGRNLALLASVQAEDALINSAVLQTLETLAKRKIISNHCAAPDHALILMALLEGIGVRITLMPGEEKRIKSAVIEAIVQLLS
jgi:TetR/AcrR family transcriptional regulator, repressor for uid operon